MADGIRGLAAIKKHQEEVKAAEEARSRPKADWFKWPNKNVNVATFQFLQELDEGSLNYVEKNGIGFIAVEHQAPGPDGYKRRANCSAEVEGQCYACERHAMRIEAEEGGWRQRRNLYINALVQFEGESEPKVLVISRNANSSFVAALIEEANDEDTIVGTKYKVTRTGTGTSTNWLLKRTKDEAWPTDKVEVFDLDETAVRVVEYDKQAEYYGAVYQGAGAPAQSEAPAARGTADTSAEW